MFDGHASDRWARGFHSLLHPERAVEPAVEELAHERVRPEFHISSAAPDCTIRPFQRTAMYSPIWRTDAVS